MSAKSNQYKKNIFKQEKSTGSDIEGREITLSSLKAFFRSQRLKKTLGLFFLLLSFFLLLAFISYLFTWTADDVWLDGKTINWGFLTDASLDVSNMMGRMGAVLAHLFVKKWFGVASFLVPFILFLAGVRMLISYRLLPLKKNTWYAVFFILWISTFLGYVIPGDRLLILGGGFGYEASRFLNGLLGVAGTALLLFFTMTAAAIIRFDPNFQAIGMFLAGLFQRTQKETVHAESHETDTDAAIVANKEIMDTSSEEQAEGLTWEQESNREVAEREEEEQQGAGTAVELDAMPEEKTKKPAGEDPDWEIEVANDKVTGSDYRELDDPYGHGDDEQSKISELGEFDPTLDLPRYKLPSLDLLDDRGSGTIHVNKQELEENKNRIIETLKNYSIEIDKIKATVGPTVTLYEIIPAPGIRISKIKSLENDIALSLAALGIRIIAPIPGKGTIGIEVPNSQPEIVSMKSILASERFQKSGFDLPIGLGKTIANETFIADLAKMPHLLMAGATGQGKSVGLNAILTSILYKKHPAYVKFVLVDPKKVELNVFSKIERHYLARLPDAEEAIVTETREVIRTINSLCVEMDNRYDLLKDAQARNIKEYNNKFIQRRLNPNMGHRFLPYIILFIDEFADLIMTAGKEIELPIARLAQLARAVGIHLVIATQRPSVNIITGTIKANFPARIAFRVTAKVDSRTILDSGGADQLIGRGDMLLSTGSDLLRLQCAFIDTPEIERLTEFIGLQRAYPDAFHLPEYIEDEGTASEAMDPTERDDFFEDAARLVVSTQQGSTSLIQRKLKLGYNRAGRIIDQLEAAGIVGPFEGSKAREVKIKDETSLEQILHQDNM